MENNFKALLFASWGLLNTDELPTKPLIPDRIPNRMRGI